jgi:TonB family protein
VSRGLLFSALLHAATFLFVLAAPASRGPRWQPTDSIAVDLVAASPRAGRAAAAPQVSAPEPAAEPVPEPPVEKPAEAKPAKKPAPQKAVAPREIRKDAPRRRDEPTLEERIRQRLSDVEPDAGAETAPPTPPSGSPSSPRGGPPGGTPGGSSTEVQASDFPYAWYLNTLRTRITDSWDPPGESLLTGRAKRVLVAFRVYRDGSVSDVRVDGASGTPGLDTSARRAVERAQPFPPLPDAYDGASLDVAVRFTVGGSS